MAYRSSRWRIGALLTTSLFVLPITVTSALSQSLCSTQNTGGTLAETSIYMSNGRCYDTCKASGAAFAVVQGASCWCSMYIPATTQSNGKCSDACPGYPEESCGSLASGSFGYIALDAKPLGTAGASTSKTSAGRTSPSPTPSRKAETTFVNSMIIEETMITEDEPISTPFVPLKTPSFTSTTPTTTPSTTIASTPKPTATGTPVTSVQVVTLSGSVITQTVTSTSTPPVTAFLGKEKSNKIAPGYIVAAVIASVAGIVLLCLALFWVWRRRQIAKKDEKYAANMRHSPEGLHRDASVHSKAGLLDSSTYRPLSYPSSSYPPTLTTQFSSPGINMSSTEGISPISPVDERRHSRPMLVDQRLNPNLLMAHENGSRTSIKTLEDHRDYGRMLKVMNPDAPRKSFS